MQTKRGSIIEAFVGTSIGFLVAVLSNYLVLPLFNLPVSLSDSFWIGVIFTFISFLRAYFVRRLFNNFFHSL